MSKIDVSDLRYIIYSIGEGANQAINAIKFRTGCDLLEAKDILECLLYSVDRMQLKNTTTNNTTTDDTNATFLVVTSRDNDPPDVLESMNRAAAFHNAQTMLDSGKCRWVTVARVIARSKLALIQE